MISFRKDPAGFLGMLLQLGMVGYGMPVQILAVYTAKSGAALSIQFFALGLCSSVAWLIHGIRNKNKYIALPQVPAIIFSLVIVSQVVYYR